VQLFRSKLFDVKKYGFVFERWLEIDEPIIFMFKSVYLDENEITFEGGNKLALYNCPSLQLASFCIDTFIKQTVEFNISLTINCVVIWAVNSNIVIKIKFVWWLRIQFDLFVGKFAIFICR